MGNAYLPDGRVIDYEDYLQSKEWKQQKLNRLAFDNWQCAFCHNPIDDRYETHHLNYERLGHENIETDIVTLCGGCHKFFHSNWQQIKRGHVASRDYNFAKQKQHWKDYDLDYTAMFCFCYFKRDYFFGGNINLCNTETIEDCIREFLSEHNHGTMICISEQDIKLFFRDKRYELLLAELESGKTIDEFLDERFGVSGARGGNPVRSEAKKFCTKHSVAAIKRFYKKDESVLQILTEFEKNKFLRRNENA